MFTFNIVANFVLAALATLVVSGVAKWIAGRLTTAEAARLVSFGVGCGYTVGKYSFVRPEGADISLNVAAGTGALVALVVLWFLLFRRNHVTA